MTINEAEMNDDGGALENKAVNIPVEIWRNPIYCQISQDQMDDE